MAFSLAWWKEGRARASTGRAGGTTESALTLRPSLNSSSVGEYWVGEPGVFDRRARLIVV